MLPKEILFSNFVSGSWFRPDQQPLKTLKQGRKSFQIISSLLLHIHIIRHCNAVNRITTQYLTLLMLCVLTFFHEQLNLQFERQIFEQLFIENFIYSQFTALAYAYIHTLQKFMFNTRHIALDYGKLTRKKVQNAGKMNFKRSKSKLFLINRNRKLLKSVPDTAAVLMATLVLDICMFCIVICCDIPLHRPIIRVPNIIILINNNFCCLLLFLLSTLLLHLKCY